MKIHFISLSCSWLIQPSQCKKKDLKYCSFIDLFFSKQLATFQKLLIYHHFASICPWGHTSNSWLCSPRCQFTVTKTTQFQTTYTAALMSMLYFSKCTWQFPILRLFTGFLTLESDAEYKSQYVIQQSLHHNTRSHTNQIVLQNSNTDLSLDTLSRFWSYFN